MDLFSRADVTALLADHGPPCVSILMPTHRGGSQEDPIRWKNHLTVAHERLVAEGLRSPEAAKLLEPAGRWFDEGSFWKAQCDGLAYYLGPGFERHYRLPLVLSDQVVVGNHYQITPLLPLLHGNGRYFVLALSQNAVRLLHGTRDSISEVHLKGIPANLEEAMATHDTDEVLTFHARPTSGGTWGAIFEGHGVGIDDAKDDLLRYFQQIDRGLHALLREEQAPLIVAAVDYLLPIYRQANHYPHLLAQGIAGNPDRLSSQELHAQAWALVRTLFERAQTQALEIYNGLAGTGRTAHELAEILAAAHEGQVETLLVAAGQACWGHFEPATMHVTLHDEPEPGDEDLVNLAALRTLQHGRPVYMIAPERMPDGDALAAVFFLPLAKHHKGP